MFRLRLALVILFSFSFVLFLGVALYWGSNQVVLYFQRSQSAYDTFDHYERLSLEAYRYFKHRMDRLILDRPITEVGLKQSKNRLYDAMDELRTVVINTPSAGSRSGKWLDKSVELESVARFTAFLETSKYQFDEVERIHQEGNHELALQMLSKFSEEEIDGKFQPLIDAVINAERERAAKAKQELEALVAKSHWIAIAVSSLAALFSLTSGVLLLRGVKKPIEALMKGTDEIAAGNLVYRINLDSNDEFSFLAAHFNQMAQEFGLQQQKLREGRALLEKKVAERTFELHQLNEELKRMDIARRELLADISHELRTPITVICGEAEVTLRGHERDADDYKDALQRIVELAMQLGKYVNDLLFLARADTANLQFEWDYLNLTELIASTVEDFHVMAQENSITVSLTTPDEPLWVRGDKQRLRQVLFILGDNACQYSKPGGHIELTLWTDENEVNFSLSDQGIGIPAEDLERIFDRKFRSKNALKSRDDGSGLGLPMARSILKAHGGHISVSSTENSGSQFMVSLPLVSIEQDTFSNERAIS